MEYRTNKMSTVGRISHAYDCSTQIALEAAESLPLRFPKCKCQYEIVADDKGQQKERQTRYEKLAVIWRAKIKNEIHRVVLLCFSVDTVSRNTRALLWMRKKNTTAQVNKWQLLRRM